MAYAERTDVPTEKSIAEAVTLVKRAGPRASCSTKSPGALCCNSSLAAG